jgi:4-hydroxy-4-methyl-2-oxoglutarate aldolase
MMRNVAVRNIPRASQEAVAALGAAGVATVHEAQGRSGLLAPYMRPIFSGAAIAGPAVTCLVAPGDNWTIHVAMELCQAGDILVIGCMTENTDGMIGDLICTALQVRGVKGVVLDTGCRDVRVLSEMGFPVWSRAISARGTVKATLGNVNLPTVCAGQLVHAGDVVIADDDGVCIVPRTDAARVADLARQRIEKEEKSRQRYLKGELSLDVAPALRAGLAPAGFTYVDSAADL